MFEYFKLTNSQMAIWETESFFQGTAISNIGGTLLFKETIDFTIWEKAVNRVIETNDSLRLKLILVEDNPMQYLSEYEYLQLEFIDFTGKAKKEQDTWIEEQMQKPFDKYHNNLFFFISMKSWDGLHGGFLKLHHIVGDGWTIGLLASQVIENYYHINSNIHFRNINLKYSYLEYLKSDEEYLNSANFQKDRRYWIEKFKDKPSLFSLKPRNKDYYNSKADRLTFIVEEKQYDTLKKYCSNKSTSPAILFEAALGIYISRFFNIQDFVIGTSVLNRSGIRQKQTAGMFVRTVPIKIQIDDMGSFKDLCKRISTEHISVFRHQRYPYTLLLSEIRKKHKITDNLFDITVSYQNTKISKSNNQDNFKSHWYFNKNLSDQLQLSINDRDDVGIFVLQYDYIIDFFNKDEIYDLHKRVMHLLMQSVLDENMKICDMEIVDEKERNKLLYEFNDTFVEYSKDKCIHQLFEEQVKQTPNEIAVIFKDKDITYFQLNQKSNSLARVLRNNGVTHGSVVALMLNRSENVFIAQLAILKSGACYLPIDPYYPAERIRFMLEDSGANIIITTKDLENQHLQGLNVNKICIDQVNFSEVETNNSPNINSSNDVAYLIYTSGSTGKPKGTIITHRSVVNFCDKNPLNIYTSIISEELKRLVSVTTISFDIFITESFLPLLNGLTVIMADGEEQNIQSKFNKLVINNNVEILQTTTTRMKLLLMDKNNFEYLYKLKVIILGGESFPVSLFNQLKDITNAEIFNIYGPTETTVWSTKTKVTSEDITIGKPIANTQIYILDKYMKPVPIGVIGEIYIGGDGVALGYHNKTKLTEERFLLNPFMISGKIYKTGDLGYRKINQDIVCLGRNDFQVKIRGIRIELGEIENAIYQYKLIKQVVVSDILDNQGNQYLCAYYVSDEQISSDDIRLFIKILLPDYMIPLYFVAMEELPFTPNGKINKSALPIPSYNEMLPKERILPRNEFEIKLADILCNIFEIKDISIDDHFFHDLGGDSVDIIHLQLLFEQNSIDVKTEDIYNNPTIRYFSEKFGNIMAYSNFDKQDL